MKILYLSLTFLALFSLSACSSEADSSPKESESANESKASDSDVEEASVFHVSGVGVLKGKESKIDFADLHISILAGGEEWLLPRLKEKGQSRFHSTLEIKEFQIRIEKSSSKKLLARLDPEVIKGWEAQTFTFDENNQGEIRLELN